MVVGSRHMTVQNSIKEHQRVMIFDALLMMHQTERLRTEGRRWENDARFEYLGENMKKVCAKRNIIGRKPTSLRSTSFARSATSFNCVRLAAE